MAVVLEGGCRVTGIRDSEPTINGTLSVWPQIGRANDASVISLRTMEFATGLSPGFRNQECDEIIYVLQGAATILIDGWPYPVQPETGVYLRPGAILTVNNPGPEMFVRKSLKARPGEHAPHHPTFDKGKLITAESVSIVFFAGGGEASSTSSGLKRH